MLGVIEVWIRGSRRSDFDRVQDKARKVPGYPQHSRAAGMWSSGLHTIPQFPGAPWSFPKAAWLAFHKPFIWSRTGFLYLGTIDLLGQIIHCLWGCHVYCRMLSSIPDLYPLDVSGIFLTFMTTRNVFRGQAKSPLGG